MGGAEKVAEELGRMFPDATLYTTVALPERIPNGIRGRHVVTTWMQRLPFINKLYRAYFLLYPLAIPTINVSDHDVVVSSSSGYAKGVRARRDAIHVCYCHTPMRWAWRFDDYAKHDSFGPARRLILRNLTSFLRRWDIAAARQPDYYIANSQIIANRIEQVYGRKAEVIPPPINTERFRPSDVQGNYYLVLSRLVSYKRLDLAVRACNELDRQLIVVGAGPDFDRLKLLGGPTVHFKGRLPDEEVNAYAAQCQALIFPGEEDFGMTPLEVAAAGRPTIAYKAGGALETIIDGTTGVFFEQQEVSQVKDAIVRFESLCWSKERLQEHAHSFSIAMFQTRMLQFLEKVGARL